MLSRGWRDLCGSVCMFLKFQRSLSPVRRKIASDFAPSDWIKTSKIQGKQYSHSILRFTKSFREFRVKTTKNTLNISALISVGGKQKVVKSGEKQHPC